ncbi:MAG: hypothetical protein AAES65_03360 [Candidatus Thiodiazotropha sp. (ex. Lucinoma kazani)]
MKTVINISLAVSVVLMSGCAALTDPKPPYKTPEKKREMVKAVHPETYIRVTTANQRKLKQLITINNPNIALATALSKALPRTTPVPEDDGVNLSQPVAISAHRLPGDEFLTYLSGITGYQYRLDGRLLYIRSHITKKWNLASFVGMPTARAAVGGTSEQGKITKQTGDGGSSSTGQSGRSLTTEITHQENAWEEVVENARKILGVQKGSSAPQADDKTAWLAPNERLGTIHAGGPPPMMQKLDEYLSNLEREAHAQLHSDLLVIDLSYSQEQAHGIDWTATLEDGNELVFEGSAASVVADAASYQMKALWEVGEWTLDAVLDLLDRTHSSYESRRLRATTVNGGTSYLGIGDEFSFISEINATPDDSGNVVTTSTLSRVQVGIRMQVTQRLLSSGRVLIEATPIISSVTRMRELESGGQKFETPDLAMQDVTFRIIARPGEPVYLGGISYKKVLDTLKSLPTPIGALLGSSKLGNERREIAMFINVKEVEL